MLPAFKDDVQMQKFADFVEEVDSWVDVHNSNIENNAFKPLKAGNTQKVMIFKQTKTN